MPVALSLWVEDLMLWCLEAVLGANSEGALCTWGPWERLPAHPLH